MPVESIGGFFFRARDPDSLAIWYAEHLGIGPGLGRTTKGAEGPYWRIGGGPVVFQPFPESTTYFAPDHHYMLNFRVSNLEGMLTRFERSGIAAKANVGDGLARVLNQLSSRATVHGTRWCATEQGHQDRGDA